MSRQFKSDGWKFSRSLLFDNRVSVVYGIVNKGGVLEELLAVHITQRTNAAGILIFYRGDNESFRDRQTVIPKNGFVPI